MQEDTNGKPQQDQRGGSLRDRLRRARVKKIVKEEGGVTAQAERRILNELGEDVTKEEGTGQ